MTDAILHASGFIDAGSSPPRASGVRITSYNGSLADVANGVIARMREFHDVRVSTTRDLSGLLRIVEATCDVEGTAMWHVFTTASDQWPMAEPPNETIDQ